MLIYPAIDLYEGEAVRLYKGDYAQKTVYSKEPVEVAKKFKACGATRIHLVDLQGAKFGNTPNFQIISDIKKETGLFTEVGGGIRSLETIEKYIAAGIDRVILGTVAVENEELLKEAVSKYKEKIAVGIDLKEGFVAIKGWTESSTYDAYTFCQKMQDLGVSTIICTDISRDGAMKGTNTGLYQDLSEKFDLDLIASGGVSTMEDIRALREMKIHGAIIGKAYYTGAIDLETAIKEAE